MAPSPGQRHTGVGLRHRPATAAGEPLRQQLAQAQRPELPPGADEARERDEAPQVMFYSPRCGHCQLLGSIY